MQPRIKAACARGFTLLELLVSIAIIAILIAILLPALSSARRSGITAKCLSNHKSLAMAAQAYAVADERDLALPVHPLAPFFRNEGYYDYGGANGMEGEGWGASDGWGVASRPLNRIVAGGDSTGPNPDMAIFADAADTGIADSLNYFHQAEFAGKTVLEAYGTSYLANCTRSQQSAGSGPESNVTEQNPAMVAYLSRHPVSDTASEYPSIGPYLRPLTRIPITSEVVLFVDGDAWSALWNTVRFARFDAPASVPGWHDGRSQFAASFFDGSGRMISLDKDDIHLPPEMDPYQIRGTSFRFDCRPQPSIIE